MLDFIKNKYFLLCLATAFVILSSSHFVAGDTNSDLTGIVYDISESSSGFVFKFESSSGEQMSCFFEERPTEYCAYTIEGTYSSDNTLFFVSSMKGMN